MFALVFLLKIETLSSSRTGVFERDSPVRLVVVREGEPSKDAPRQSLYVRSSVPATEGSRSVLLNTLDR